MATLDEQVQTFFRNLETTTGKTVDEWVTLVLASGARTHRDMRTLLQDEHGIGYGHANAIANKAIERRDGVAGGDDLVNAQYSGKKAELRPLYDTLLEQLEGFGDDVEVAPKKTYVSVRRSKQFGLIQPAPGRLDVGINLKGVEANGALEAAGSWNSMVTHRVRVAWDGDVVEAVRWLKEAYERA